MKNIVIVGAGGFGREVQWLLERINEKEFAEKKSYVWAIKGYIDDAVPVGTLINGQPVLGGLVYLKEYTADLSVVCAIGNSKIRKKVINELLACHNLDFPTIIDPSVLSSDTNKLGQGNIICASNVLTVNIDIEDFVIVNLDCTIGHDAKLHSYVTVYPSVNISGNVTIGSETEIGTGSHIIQGKIIGSDTIVGAGTVVIKDIPSSCTAVGNPARILAARD